MITLTIKSPFLKHFTTYQPKTSKNSSLNLQKAMKQKKLKIMSFYFFLLYSCVMHGLLTNLQYFAFVFSFSGSEKSLQSVLLL